MVQLTVNVDEKTYRELEKQREETGLPISQLIQMKLKGFEPTKVAKKSA